MPVRISERDLISPSLRLAASHPNGEITTAELIEELTDMFQPEGDDAEILEGRQDTKFSQKVRNLVSARIKGNALAEHPNSVWGAARKDRICSISSFKEGQSQQEGKLAPCFNYPGCNKAFGAVVRRINDNVNGTTIIIKKIHTGLAEAAAVQIGTDHLDADCLKDTRHSSVATGALPNIAAKFLVFD